MCRERGECDDQPVRVETSIVVDAAGAVVDVRAEGPRASAVECVRAKLAGWTFPASKGRTTINVAFNFLWRRPAHNN
jgi:hypothetical protein